MKNKSMVDSILEGYPSIKCLHNSFLIQMKYTSKIRLLATAVLAPPTRMLVAKAISRASSAEAH